MFVLVFKMSSFPFLYSPLRFSDIDSHIVIVPATCLVIDLTPLGTIQAIFAWKKKICCDECSEKITFKLTIGENVLTQ